MCDLFGCCNEKRPKKFEWLEDDTHENREKVEALRRSIYSQPLASVRALDARKRDHELRTRDIELPDGINVNGQPNNQMPVDKKCDIVLDLGGSKGSESQGVTPLHYAAGVVAAPPSQPGTKAARWAAKAAADGHVFKKGDRKSSSPPKERPKDPPVPVSSIGAGQRLGGISGSSDAKSDAGAPDMHREAAQERKDALPQGFSAAGSQKLTEARPQPAPTSEAVLRLKTP
jgi:hypothetical protein